MLNCTEVQRQDGAGISRSPVGGYGFPTERTVKVAVLADLLDRRSITPETIREYIERLRMVRAAMCRKAVP